jgi:chromosome segregation ATPase
MWVSNRDMLQAECARLATERDDWQQRAEAAERASKVDADVLQTAQQWISESNGKINVLTEERDAARADKHCLRLELEQVRVRCNEAREERDAAEQGRTESRAEVVRLTAERDSARAEVVPAVLSLRAERDSALADLREISVERDSASEHRDYLQVANEGLREERDAARAEAEGLRADLLAHPPEHAARIAELEATIETLREDGKNCEAEYVAQRDEIMDMHRKTDHDQVIIEGLREALERTERRLLTLSARQIPPALVGLLGVIRREAAAAEKMIL